MEFKPILQELGTKGWNRAKRKLELLNSKHKIKG